MKQATPILGECIGGDIYAWGDDQLIRLFPHTVDKLYVEWFESVARALIEAGVPVPDVVGTVELSQGTGIIFERIAGPTLGDHLLHEADITDENLARMGRVFAQTHLRLHDVRRVPAVPVGPRKFGPMIDFQAALSSAQQQALLAMLIDLSKGPFAGDCGPCLCHGDYHPLNVMLSPRGPVVIDWENVHLGDPLADVARAMLILDGLPIEQPDLPTDRLPHVARFAQAYLDHYVALFSSKYEADEELVRQRIDAWRPVICAIRLSDKRPHLEPWLLAQIDEALSAPS